MQSTLLQRSTSGAPVRTATVTQAKRPKPSAARSEDRRIVQRQERLVSAWLRSLTTR